MQNLYSTQIYYTKKAFVVFFILFMFATILILLIGRLIHNFYFALIGFSFISIAPFIYQKKYKEFFTKDVILEFEPEALNIQFPRTSKNSDQITICWKNVKAYKIYFSQSNLTFLDIYLKNSRMKEFGFVDNKSQEEAIKSVSVFTTFHHYLNIYNLQSTHSKINLKQGFLLTKSGTAFLILVGVGILTLTVLSIFTFDKSFRFLPMSIFLYLPLLAKRREDKKLFSLMSNLDPRDISF